MDGFPSLKSNHQEALKKLLNGEPLQCWKSRMPRKFVLNLRSLTWSKVEVSAKPESSEVSPVPLTPCAGHIPCKGIRSAIFYLVDIKDLRGTTGHSVFFYSRGSSQLGRRIVRSQIAHLLLYSLLLKTGSNQGEREFRAEVEIISRIHHRHLVSLVGYCIAENQRLLVYEFLPNNILDHHLHGKGMPVMEWPKRLKIVLGAARGLAYLHDDCNPKIIHRDIKSANILLNDAFEARYLLSNRLYCQLGRRIGTEPVWGEQCQPHLVSDVGDEQLAIVSNQMYSTVALRVSTNDPGTQ